MMHLKQQALTYVDLALLVLKQDPENANKKNTDILQGVYEDLKKSIDAATTGVK